MRTLNAALDALDMALTRKSGDRSWHDQVWFELVGTELYLSDGGYSRVVFSLLEDPEGTLFLTSNSTQAVKAAWETCEFERAEVTAAFRELIQQYTRTGP